MPNYNAEVSLNRICLENTMLVAENLELQRENKGLKAKAKAVQPIMWDIYGIAFESGVSIITANSTGYSLSGFVETKEDGELLVDLFNGLVNLEYCYYEPNRFLVKVMVEEEKHVYILEELDAVIKINDGFILPSQIANFMKRHNLPRKE